MFISNLGSYTATISKQLQGTLRENFRAVINTDSDLLTYIRGKENYLTTEVEKANNFMAVFSQLTDAIPVGDNMRIDINTDLTQQVEASVSKVTEGIDFIVDTYGDGFTLTDVNGRIYNMKLFKSNGLSSNHTLACQFVNGIERPFLWLQNNKVYFNPLLYTADFATPYQNSTILSRLKACCQATEQNFDGTLSTLVSGSETIFDSFEDYGSGSTLYHLLDQYAGNEYYKGKIRHFFDVFKEYIDSSEINNALLSTVKAIKGGISGIEAFMNTLSARTTKAISVVKQFYIDLSSAWVSGGFKGVLMFIFNFFRAAARVTTADGRLQFTDNTTLVPQQYIVGMVPYIVSAVTTLAGIIISIFQPIVGAAVSGLGALMYGIFKSISYDSSATKCGMQTSDFVGVNAAPWSIIRYEGPATPTLRKLMNDSPIISLDVPGGILLLGPGTFNADETVQTVRAEFHPDYRFHVNPRSYAAFRNQRCTWLDFSLVKTTGTIKYDQTTCDNLVKAYYSYVDDYAFVNDENDRLSETADTYIQRNIGYNTFVFLYWLYHITTDGVDLDLAECWDVQDEGNHQWISNWYDDPDTDELHNSNDFWKRSFSRFAPWLFVKPGGSETTYDLWSHLSWSFVATQYVGVNELDTTTKFANMFNFIYWNSEPVMMGNSFDWAVVPAKYDAASFLGWIVTTIAVTALTAAVTVVATISIRRAVQQKRAELNKSVENAWESYKEDQITYKEYRATVKKANRWQTLIGGTRYDYENYWNGDTSAGISTISTNPSVVSSVIDLTSDIIDLGDYDFTKAQALGVSDEYDRPITLEDIYRLIKGDLLPVESHPNLD